MNRWLVCGAAAALIAASAPAWALDAVYAGALKLYGGSYSPDCGNATAPRLRVTADALMVEQGGKRLSGRNVQAAYSYFGSSPPPGYQVVLLSEVRAGVALEFIVYRDKAGLYITLDGDPKIQATLGKALLGHRYRACDAAARKQPAPVAQAPVEPITGPADLLADPRFKSLYFKALGTRAQERWLATLDGPSPPVKKLAVSGTEYLFASSCKPHDCAEHNTVLLYSAARAVVYGKLFERGRSTLIGAPPPDVARELERLWRAEWRQGRG